MKLNKLTILITLCFWLPVRSIAVQWEPWESYERGFTQWTTDGDGGLIDSGIVGDVASEGDFAFGGRVTVKEIANSKAGFYLEPNADFSSIEGIAFDIYNGTRADWSVSLMVQTGEAWHWAESVKVELKQGWNRNLAFNLKDSKFNEGKAIQHLEMVKKLAVLLYPAKPTQGALYIDNIRTSGLGASAISPKRLENIETLSIDSFEGEQTNWIPVFGGAVAVVSEKVETSHGGTALRLKTNLSSPAQNSVFGIEDVFDFTGIQSMVLDIYNPSPSGLVSLVVSTGEGWDHCEAPSATLKQGWNHNVTFDFQATNFKSEKTHWKSTGRIPGLSAKRLGLQISTGEFGQSGIIVDNLRIRSQKTADIKAFLPPKNSKGLTTEWITFDNGNPLKPVIGGSAATGAAVVNSYVSDGRKSLRMDFLTKELYQNAEYLYPSKISLLGVKALEFDVYNPGQGGVEISLAVKVGDDYRWYSCKPVNLAAGWNKKVRLPLEGGVFKSAETQWQYGSELTERRPEDIREAFFVIETPRIEKGSIYVSTVKMIRRPDLEAIGIPITVQGSYEMKVIASAHTYELWDSGISEGGFEEGLNSWQGQNGGGMELSVADVVEGPGVTEGDKALRVRTRGSGKEKCAVVFSNSLSAGSVLPDLSNKSRIRMDVYNPGRTCAVALAFVVGSGSQWVESAPILLKGGWNRNLTIDLDGNNWKYASGTTVPGATKSWGSFDPVYRTAAMLSKMYILFHKAARGDFYVDNIRFGEETGSSAETEGNLELGATLYGGRYLEVKGSGVVGHAEGSEAWVEAASARATLKGLGQNISVFFGETITPFDDPLFVLTGRTGLEAGLGSFIKVPNSNVAGVEHSGALGLLQLQTLAVVPWETNRWTPGESILTGLRTKCPVPGGGTLGASWVTHRTGYDSGADYMNDPVEQSVQIIEGDISLGLPFGLSLEGGAAETVYAADSTVSVAFDERKVPATIEYIHETDRQRVVAQMGYKISVFDISLDFNETGSGFYGALSDDIYPGSRSIVEKVVLSVSEKTKLTLEGDQYQSLKDTYMRNGFTGRLENDRTEKFNYRIIANYKIEGNDIDSAVAGSSDEREQITTATLILGYRPFEKTLLGLGAYYLAVDPVAITNDPHNNIAVFGDVAQSLWRGGIFSMEVLSFSANSETESEHRTAMYATLSHSFGSLLRGQIWYGAPVFSGDEYSIINWNQDDSMGLKLTGSF